MPEEKTPGPESEAQRDLEAGQEGGYQTDTFSRNDGEGLPGPEESAAQPSPALAAGEEGGYQTDTFSRNDREGLPAPDDAADA